MPGTDPSSAPVTAPEPESYARIVARPALVLALLAALAAVQFRPRPEPAPAPSTAPAVAASEPAEPEPAPAASKPKKKAPRPAPPPAPTLDLAAVAKAEAALDEAARERARAEARLADAEKALEAASRQVAVDIESGKSIASRVKDPSARISAASSKGGFLRGERDRLKAELTALERVPTPKATPLMAKSAVAKPTDGAEYHFEIRRNRVSFIDLDRLVEMVKTDARLRLRSGGHRGRLSSVVGPVGSFSMRYEMGRAIPEGFAEIADVREVSYNLLGWEIIPEGPNRGETFEATRNNGSNFGRAINRLSPNRDTITMWIYPDGFALYRRLRDDLHARGFLVAARPLPEGTSIKGSPSGSLSAGQ